VIGSPNHWHAQMTIDACAAGKDVSVEKPLTHTFAKGAKVIAAQNRYQRSVPHLIKAREILKSGQFGAIHKIHMSWNRNMLRRRRGRSLMPTVFATGAGSGISATEVSAI